MIDILANIGSNHKGNMEVAKDVIFNIKECGANALVVAVFESREENRITKRDLYDFKVMCDLAGLEFIPSLHYEKGKIADIYRFLWKELEIERMRFPADIDSWPFIDTFIAINVSLISLQKNFLGQWADSKHKFLKKIEGKYKDIKLPAFDSINFQGVSDHTEGIVISQVAMSRGATIIEKHIAIDDEEEQEGISLSELQELCIFRDEVERILE